jgi:hypothetical protein
MKNKEDTYEELCLLVENDDKVNKIVTELVLCYNNQYNKSYLSDRNAWILHKILLEIL